MNVKISPYMDFSLTLVLVWSNRADCLCAAAKQQFGLWEIAISVQTNLLFFLLRFKCQFSPAIDSDDFNQLKEAKQADVDDKLCEVIALCEAA